jgi:hypothetical protein
LTPNLTHAKAIYYNTVIVSLHVLIISDKIIIAIYSIISTRNLKSKIIFKQENKDTRTEIT